MKEVIDDLANFACMITADKEHLCIPFNRGQSSKTSNPTSTLFPTHAADSLTQHTHQPFQKTQQSKSSKTFAQCSSALLVICWLLLFQRCQWPQVFLDQQHTCGTAQLMTSSGCDVSGPHLQKAVSLTKTICRMCFILRQSRLAGPAAKSSMTAG